MSDKTLTAEMLARLQRHYIKPGELMPGGMFIPEVTLAGRRADALYVGFFASRGKFLVGHEVKVSRADWLHELAQPEKAEIWFRECHSWYLVAAHESIVREGELPPGWGLMVPGPSKTRMKVLVKAEQRPDTCPSWPATHAIVQRVDSLRMDAITADREKQRTASEVLIAERVEARLKYESGSERDRERADRAEALLAEVQAILGFEVRESRMAWGEDQVSVDLLRSSFGAWLAAEKAVRDGIGSHRLSAVRSVRETLKQVEEDLGALIGKVS
ncbi:MAG: hypothetical protein WED09_07345 [Homoserinimonas sp.]